MNGFATSNRGSLGRVERSTTPREAASGARAADYVADIFLILLLAAPFVLFESPGTFPEAAVLSQAAAPVASAAPAGDTPASPIAAAATR